jgi:hypothetical protein
MITMAQADACANRGYEVKMKSDEWRNRRGCLRQHEGRK